jgi:Protein of unknown function (DUF3662)/FHA domain
MRLARELERRLERLVEGATAAVFRGKLHPVDIADRMIRQLEFLEEEGFAGPEIPNRITITLSPADVDLDGAGPGLSTELARAVTVTAAHRGWRINGPVSVEVVTDDAVPRGVVECHGTTLNGPLPPWGHLIALDGSGAREITDNRVVVGRAPQCDIVLAMSEVSRQHALIARSGGSTTITDLGSSNGTVVNGRLIGDDPSHLVPGDEVVLGTVRFGFRTI